MRSFPVRPATHAKDIMDIWDDAAIPFLVEEHTAEEMRSEDHEDDQERFIEEGAKVKIVKMENQPTKQEFVEHMSSHIPFRSWCPY